ncbi:hypothetical protein N2152v2_000526 [Parachlorella kessleri]
MAEVEASVEMAPEQAPAEQEEEQPAEEAPAEEAQQEEPKTAPKTARARKTPASKATPATGGPGTDGRAKRERKQVERFNPVSAEKEEHFVIKEGKGTKLRDIPNVAFKLGKVTGRDELAEHLHQLLYRRKGTQGTRKRDIMDFSGFAFEEAEEEKELKYRRESLGKWKLDLIHKLLDVLDLPRGQGEKAGKVDKVLEFLQEPKPLSEVNLADKEAKKREQAKAKKEREAAKKEKEAQQKEKEKAKKEKEKAKKEQEKAKKEKAGSAKKEKAGGSATKRKAASAEKRRPAKKAKKEEAEASEPEEDAGAEPMDTEDAAAAELSSEQLKSDIEAELGSLSKEELQGVNIKLLLAKLSDKYGFDVKPRKAEIKTLAVEFCNQRFEAEGAPKEDEEAAGEAGEAEQGAAVEEPEQQEDAKAEGAAEEAERAVEQPEEAAPAEEAEQQQQEGEQEPGAEEQAAPPEEAAPPSAAQEEEEPTAGVDADMAHAAAAQPDAAPQAAEAAPAAPAAEEATAV